MTRPDDGLPVPGPDDGAVAAAERAPHVPGMERYCGCGRRLIAPAIPMGAALMDHVDLEHGELETVGSWAQARMEAGARLSYLGLSIWSCRWRRVVAWLGRVRDRLAEQMQDGLR